MQALKVPLPHPAKQPRHALESRANSNGMCSHARAQAPAPTCSTPSITMAPSGRSLIRMSRGSKAGSSRSLTSSLYIWGWGGRGAEA